MSGTAVIAAIAVGLGSLYVLPKVFGSNNPANNDKMVLVNSTSQDRITNQTEIPMNVQQIGYLTPEVLGEVQKIIPDFEGSDVSTLIHGGSIQINCNYRGTNGKCYTSEYDAWLNGSVPDYDPLNPLRTKPT